MLPNLPASFNEIEVYDKLKQLKGPKGLDGSKDGGYATIPLNIFLR